MTINERADKIVENGLAKLLFRTVVGMLVAVCAFLLHQANAKLEGVAVQLADLKTNWAVGQAIDKGNHDNLAVRIDGLIARVSVLESRQTGVRQQ